jgi:hypothetical protein
VVATPFLKRRQQVLKPRDSPEITDTLKPSLSAKRGPGSWTGAKAQDGPPGIRMTAWRNAMAIIIWLKYRPKLGVSTRSGRAMQIASPGSETTARRSAKGASRRHGGRPQVLTRDDCLQAVAAHPAPIQEHIDPSHA